MVRERKHQGTTNLDVSKSLDNLHGTGGMWTKSLTHKTLIPDLPVHIPYDYESKKKPIPFTATWKEEDLPVARTVSTVHEDFVVPSSLNVNQDGRIIPIEHQLTAEESRRAAENASIEKLIRASKYRYGSAANLFRSVNMLL